MVTQTSTKLAFIAAILTAFLPVQVWLVTFSLPRPLLMIFSAQNFAASAVTISHPNLRQVANPNGPVSGWTSVGCFTYVFPLDTLGCV
jgi:hypothetical protein